MFLMGGTVFVSGKMYENTKLTIVFLLLARYVPICSEDISVYIEDKRPTDRPTLHFGKFRTTISLKRFIRSNSYLVLG